MQQACNAIRAEEQGKMVFSTSMPIAHQGRPEDDWTLEAHYAPLIIGGQVSSGQMAETTAGKIYK